jgi:hypothetical protein
MWASFVDAGIFERSDGLIQTIGDGCRDAVAGFISC